MLSHLFSFCSSDGQTDSSRMRVCVPTFMSLSVCSVCWSQIPDEAFVGFTSLRLLVWVWFFFGWGGYLHHWGLCSSCVLRVGVRRASQRKVDHQEPVSTLRLSLCHHLRWMEGVATSTHETKSGASCVSVRACAEGGRGRREAGRMTTHKHTCASFCQEMRSQTMKVTRTSFLVYEVWRLVRGGNSQWSDCVFFSHLWKSNTRERERELICVVVAQWAVQNWVSEGSVRGTR